MVSIFCMKTEHSSCNSRKLTGVAAAGNVFTSSLVDELFGRI